MRTIDPNIFTDDFIGTQSMRLRILWMGLILSLADDQGRLVDNPALIRVTVFPYDTDITTKDIETDLRILAKAHKVVRYHAGSNGDGKELIQIAKWWRYQIRAQWAKRSTYPAPLKWVDRVRCHTTGNVIDEENWKLEGGFMSKLPRRIPTQLPSAQPSKQASRQARREDEDEDEARGRGRQKDLPTPLPPSTKTADKAAGGLAGKEKKSDDQFSALKPQEKKRARAMMPVLLSSGMKKEKAITLLEVVATRSSIHGNGTAYSLAALASAYADDKAEKKPAVAAYRMEHDNVDPEFFNPSKWDVLPEDILKAAGIENLGSYIAEQKMNKFLGSNSVDQKIAALRNRSN